MEREEAVRGVAADTWRKQEAAEVPLLSAGLRTTFSHKISPGRQLALKLAWGDRILRRCPHVAPGADFGPLLAQISPFCRSLSAQIGPLSVQIDQFQSIFAVLRRKFNRSYFLSHSSSQKTK